MVTTQSYRISMAAKLTGIPAETLRIWERRYGSPRPSRRSGGARMYDDEEIERLKLVARAIAAGHRAGDVANLPVRALEALDASARKENDVSSAAACLDAVVRDDPAELAVSLRRAALLYGPMRFVTEVAHPLAVRVGKLWESGKLGIRQEHLFTCALSTQIRVLLTMLEGGRAPVVVLATFPGELHALGLEMVAAYVAARGSTPLLLGASCPPEQIAEAAQAFGADAVGISVSAAANRTETRRHTRELVAAAQGREIWIGGAGAQASDGVSVIDDWRALDRAIARHERT